MAGTIAFDVARLFVAPLNAAPRGIDRIDLMLARHFFCSDDSPHWGILPTPWGIRAFSARQVRAGLAHLCDLWPEEDEGQARDLRLQWVISRLHDKSAVESLVHSRNLSLGEKASRMMRHLGATGFSFGYPVRGVLPKGTVYLNVGQFSLSAPFFHNWLPARPDVTAVFMLHDMIPREFPEYVPLSTVRHHERVIYCAARHAHAIITTTEHARERVALALAEHSRPDVPTLARGLPLPDGFAVPRSSLDELAGKRYFVITSTIEPRKNHDLLLKVWENLVRSCGDAAPHLVIVGSKGWDSDRVLAGIDQRGLGRRVHHVSGLSTPALARLLLGASALLSPSLAEGFGLPVLEANALGVPTIASDIAAHREVANGQTILLPAHDAEVWAKAIMEHPAPSAIRNSLAVPLAATSSAYCADVEIFLEECARSRQGRALLSPLMLKENAGAV